MASKENDDTICFAECSTNAVWSSTTTLLNNNNNNNISAGSSKTVASHTNKEKTKSRRRGWGVGDGWEERGGYMNAKKQKLVDQFEANRPNERINPGSSSNIFKGVSIHVNGYTRPSSDELKRLMTIHGGRYQHYMSKTHVTHVIATNLPNSKVGELKGADKVVRPEWITDSIKAGKLLSYQGYQLYTAQSTIQKGMNKFTIPLPSNTSMSSRTGMGTFSDMGVPDGVSSTCVQADAIIMDTNIDHENIESSRVTLVTDHVSNDVDTRDEESFQANSANRTVNLANWPYEDSAIASETSALNNSAQNVPMIDQVNGVKTTPTVLASLVQDSTENTNFSTNYHGAHRSPSKAGDSSFVSEFYNHSRLHHLSTWKAEFTEYVNKLQASSDGNFPGREKLVKLCPQNAGKDSRMDVDVDFLPTAGMQGKPRRVIMHVDMDCFFVSVGLLDRPELRGKPVAVTHSRGKGVKPNPGADLAYERTMWETNCLLSKSVKKGKNSYRSTSDHVGHVDEDEQCLVSTTGGTLNEKEKKGPEEFYSMSEIASCSYEARQAGVKNGTFMGPAKKLCPQLVTIPYEFEKYNEVSRQLYSIVASYSHDIEAVSCDEMLVDCTDLLADTGTAPLDFVAVLRDEIYQKTGCPASAGLGPNILMSRMATRQAKPNGQFYLEQDQVVSFIKDQPIRDLPGIGWSMSRKLTSMNVQTCGDMQKVAMATLQKEFGPKVGQSLFRYCRGQDDRPIKVERERKSVSAEINYGIRFKEEKEADKFLTELSEEVHSRLEKIDSKGRSITLKLKVRRDDAPVETAKFLGHGVCNSLSKSVMLPMATDNSQVIAKECITILRAMRVKAADLRGIGIQMQKLEPAVIGPNAMPRGHQSILNFAVPKSTCSTGAPAKVKEKDVPLVRNDVSGMTPSKQKDNHKTCDTSRLFCPGQKAYPPLPMLPSLKTPSPARHRNRDNISLSASHHGNASTGDYLPSPSQVDLNVLKELPADIREQIEQAMENTKRRKHAGKETAVNLFQQPIGERVERPGCSHWSNSQTNVTDGSGGEVLPVGATSQGTDCTCTPARDHSVVPLPSPSQLDLDCLNALPEELQKEICQAYALQEKQNGPPTNNVVDSRRSKLSAWEMIMSATAKSPSKKESSPNKGRSPRHNKHSPQFKIPQGRPGRKTKHNPRKLDFNRPPTIITAQVTSNQLVATVRQTRAEEDIQVTECFPSVPETTLQTDHTPESDARREITQYVNLCGRFTLRDVKCLLKEWLLTCPDPEREDLEIIVQYLSELVVDKNLDMVDLLLKFLRRQVSKISSKQWSAALINVVSNIQSFIFAHNGGHLKGFT